MPDHEPECSASVSLKAWRTAGAVDQGGGERFEGQQLVVDPEAARALEHHIELLVALVAVLGRSLPGLQPPETSAHVFRLELLAEVGVVDLHLVRRAPEGVGGLQDAVAHVRVIRPRGPRRLPGASDGGGELAPPSAGASRTARRRRRPRTA